MWTGVFNVQMYQLINNKLTIALFKERAGNANSFINVPEVVVNKNIITDMEKRFDSEIFIRPLPPWNEAKLNEFESIDKDLQQSIIFHRLDCELVKFRLKNLDLELETTQLRYGRKVKVALNGFREDFNRKSGMFVHANAIEDLLRRYKLYSREDLVKLNKNRSRDKDYEALACEVLSQGYNQRKWLRLGKRS